MSLSALSPEQEAIRLETWNAKVEALAKARFGSLQQLDEAEPYRRELRAAGINEASVQALYPFAFAGWIGGLVPLVKRSSLKGLTATSKLEEYLYQSGVLSQQAGPAALAVLFAENTPQFGSAMVALSTKISACLPAQRALNPGASKKEISEELATVLWHATFYMTNPAGASWDAPRLNIHFMEVTDLLFPHLREAGTPWSEG